ncbi:MAG: two-component sensor histidine kinase [Desulfococcus sp. 4484_242]|nr:MAG: two-component sensor histidine kinase [Desulfococcus sp. 4484_242]
MSFLEKLKPDFWDYHDIAAGSHKRLFNFRRMWKLTVFLTAGVALIPLISLTVVDYHVTQRSVASENLLRTARLVSNTRRSVFYFFEERRAALEFLVRHYTFAALNERGTLDRLLKDLKESFSGFTDLGLIDPLGYQRGYAGPFDLLGVDYSLQDWYREVCKKGIYISDVFLGFRQAPHMVIAVKRSLPNGSFYVLRATIDTMKFQGLLSGLEMAGKGDAFIINRQGILQTPSLYHGRALQKLSLPVPEHAPKTRVFETKDANGAPIIIGYRYIDDTPFILMVVKQKRGLMKAWRETRTELLIFLGISILIISGVVIWMATYLVNRIFIADQKRIATLHQVEYSNKMASIGRLAAGVAHEVNNPLAIINEKAGLIKDLFVFKKEYAGDEKLLGLVDAILASVKRAGTITKRLLSFSRHSEIRIQHIDLKELLQEVLGFFEKEAEYRSIDISIDVAPDTPVIESDRSKLQEIFLNLANNACLAMENGGHLNIRIAPEGLKNVKVTVSDDGCGIAKQDLDRVFEPFFSTRTRQGGTGLGLSLTANFVRELGGEITVESEPGKGTTFTVILPVAMERKEGNNTCEYF